jgi:hypothetical protein
MRFQIQVELEIILSTFGIERQGVVLLFMKNQTYIDWAQALGWGSDIVGTMCSKAHNLESIPTGSTPLGSGSLALALAQPS